MNHKKREPQTNAKQTAVKQGHLASEPAMPRSQKQISQKRFPGETPLTGEDRPIDQAGGKRERDMSRKRCGRINPAVLREPEDERAKQMNYVGATAGP